MRWHWHSSCIPCLLYCPDSPADDLPFSIYLLFFRSTKNLSIFSDSADAFFSAKCKQLIKILIDINSNIPLADSIFGIIVCFGKKVIALILFHPFRTLHRILSHIRALHPTQKKHQCERIPQNARKIIPQLK